MNSEQNKNKENYLDVRQAVKTLLGKWHWYVVAAVICFPVTLIFNRLATPQYEVTSSIYIKETSTSSKDKAQEFMQSFMLFNQQRNYKNEMLVIGSTPLVHQAVKNLHLEVSWYQKEGFSYYEQYNILPFQVLFDSLHCQPLKTNFDIVFSEDGQFTIEAAKKSATVYNYHKQKKTKTDVSVKLNKTAFPGDLIEDSLYRFRIFITNPDALASVRGKKYRFHFNDIKQLERRFQESLTIAPANPEVSIVNISMKSPSAEKAVDFIDMLTAIYLKKNLDRKNHLATNTLKYINDQLTQIQDSLNFAEKKLEKFRSSKQIMNISSKSTIVFDRIQQLEIEKANLEKEHKYYQYLEDYFNSNTDLADLVVPSSMGIPDKNLNELIRDLIILVNQRNELIAKKQHKSPYLKNLEIQIENLKKPILENIKFAVSTLGKNQVDNQTAIAKLQSEASQLPGTERQLVGIERKFQLNDGIYTYLLERQAEAQIAKSSNLPEHEIVEPARFIGIVFPNTRINYSLALFVVLFAPTLLIFGIQYFDDRVKNEEDLKKHTMLPVVGNIIQEDGITSAIQLAHAESMLAESFRTIHTNLNFFARGRQVQTVLVTSSVSGEGKSFVARNLANIYARMGKKTVLIGFDLRKGKQFDEISHGDDNSLTGFYLNRCSAADTVSPLGADNLFVIPTGQIPPNPLELIAGDQTAILFDYLEKNFDHIIIDTPPIGIVSDAFMLMQHAQVSLFVVRENFSQKRVIHSILEDVKEKKIENIAMVLNHSNMNDKKYRYNYYHPKKQKK